MDLLTPMGREGYYINYLSQNSSLRSLSVSSKVRIATEKIDEGIFGLLGLAASKEEPLDAILRLFQGKVTTDVLAVGFETNDPPERMCKVLAPQVELTGKKEALFPTIFSEDLPSKGLSGTARAVVALRRPLAELEGMVRENPPRRDGSVNS